MKVHIISLQRTGSKSLQSAIHNALDRPLEINTVYGMRDLGEFFHGWEFSGYKFGPEAKCPFDPKHAIKFRTAENFNDYKGNSFMPVGGNRWIQYASHDYVPDLETKHLAYLRVLLDQYKDRNYVVKTQLTTLAEDVKANVGWWMSLVTQDFDLTINLVPSDIVKWLCSNYACDHTGIFVPCAEQEEARKELKLTMPKDYVFKQLERLERHHTLASRCGDVLNVQTDHLVDPEFAKYLAGLLKVESVNIKNPKEFSAEGYENLFANYSDISKMVEEYNHLMKTLYCFPFSYPLTWA